MYNLRKKELGMYREEIKIKFLEDQYSSEESRKILSYVFYNSREIEIQLEKDLYEFNIEEITYVIRDCSPKKSNHAQRIGSVITKYIEWAIEKGFRPATFHPLQGIHTSFYEQFGGEKRLYLSKQKLENILDQLANAQDAVVPSLLFDGVCGHKFSELLNLRKRDIDWENNTLHLQDDKFGPRKVVVSDRTINLLKVAIKETIYYSQNGTVKGRKEEAELVDNEYVLRTVKVGAYSKGKSKPNLPRRRLDMIGDLVETGIEQFTSKVITYSGMIYQGYISHLKNGELESKQLSEIAELFGIRKVKVDEYQYYNTSVLSRLINLKNINELYGNTSKYIYKDFELVAKDIITEQFSRKKRVNSPYFRSLVLSAYNECAISGETLSEVLDACHIEPYFNEESHHIQNGILLRKDIHTLFDSGLITIDEDYVVKVSKTVKSRYYQDFQGRRIRLPSKKEHYPSQKALEVARSNFRL